MGALVIYDQAGKVWIIAYGETNIPQGLSGSFVAIPEGSVLESMDLTDPENPVPVFHTESRTVPISENPELIAEIRSRVEDGENIRTVIGGLDIPDSEKWALEKKVKEG